MSILVHPDKNQNDLERAEKSFEGEAFIKLSQVNIRSSFCVYHQILFSGRVSSSRSIRPFILSDG